MSASVSTIFNSFSTRQHLLGSSENSGWSLAFFIEMLSAERGTFDGGLVDGVSLTWMRGSQKVRLLGARNSFFNVPRHPYLCSTSEQFVGEWEGSSESISLVIPSDGINTAANQNDRFSFSPVGELKISQLEHLLLLLRSDVHSGFAAGPFVGETIITFIIGLLFPDNDRTCELERRDGRSEKIGKICEYINSNIDKSISLTEIANEFSISTRHLCRAFLAGTGHSVHDYIVNRRLELAISLIKQGRLSLVDIALMSGFSSHAHMSYTFRRLLGMSPTSYIK